MTLTEAYHRYLERYLNSKITCNKSLNTYAHYAPIYSHGLAHRSRDLRFSDKLNELNGTNLFNWQTQLAIKKHANKRKNNSKLQCISCSDKRQQRHGIFKGEQDFRKYQQFVQGMLKEKEAIKGGIKKQLQNLPKKHGL